MLSIIDKADPDNVIPMMIADDAWYVTHAYNGSDTLQFTLDAGSEYVSLFEEESKVLATGLRGGDNRFVIKNIDDHSEVYTVDCSLDLYDWKQTIWDTYRRLHVSLEDVLQEITPAEWTYSGQGQFGDDVTLEDARNEPVKAGTPLDILDACSECFGCVFNFDVINKHLTCIDPNSYAPSGDFISDEVNLKSIGFVGNTDNYATRLYAYGKRDDNGENPVTFADINDGKPYIDNNEFSDDVICYGWSDERYTIPENLLEAATVKLAEIAKPARSYTCEVNQLNRNVWLYMVLTMLDSKRNVRVNQQVVEWREYGRQDLDVVTLSAVPPSIEDILNSNFNQEQGLTDDDLAAAINGATDDITNAYKEAIENATNKITGSTGGYFEQIFDEDDHWVELLNLGDSMDKNQARSVWRWNKDGLGHSNNGINGNFDLALLADGSINATMMTTGILQGGQSYWNLNTGDLSIIGRFRTRADTTEEGAEDAYGLDIDPQSSTHPMEDESNVSYGPMINITGGNRENNPFIAFPMYNVNTGIRGGVDISSGNLVNMPGGYLRTIWNYSNDKSEIIASGIVSTSRAYGNSSLGGAIMKVMSYQSSNQCGFVCMSGMLSGASSIIPMTISHWRYGLSTYNGWQNSTFNVTVAVPSPQGQYWPLATIRGDNPRFYINAPQCAGASASGWSVYIQMFPPARVTSTSGVNYDLFPGAFNCAIFTMGVLVNAS